MARVTLGFASSKWHHIGISATLRMHIQSFTHSLAVTMARRAAADTHSGFHALESPPPPRPSNAAHRSGTCVLACQLQSAYAVPHSLTYTDKWRIALLQPAETRVREHDRRHHQIGNVQPLTLKERAQMFLDGCVLRLAFCVIEYMLGEGRRHLLTCAHTHLHAYRCITAAGASSRREQERRHHARVCQRAAQFLARHHVGHRRGSRLSFVSPISRHTRVCLIIHVWTNASSIVYRQSYEATTFTTGNEAFTHFEMFCTLLFAVDYVRLSALPDYLW